MHLAFEHHSAISSALERPGIQQPVTLWVVLLLAGHADVVRHQISPVWQEKMQLNDSVLVQTTIEELKHADKICKVMRCMRAGGGVAAGAESDLGFGRIYCVPLNPDHKV